MISALLLASFLAPSYDAPVGSSAGFQGLALAVRRASRSDVAKAGRLAGMLPRRDPAMYWDDRKVPAVSRAAFRAARDFAVAEWGQMIAGFRPRIVASPTLAAKGLAFSFEPRLARSGGATHFLGTDSKEPRLETVIGLRRGEFYTGEVDVHNEVLFALGTYMGLLPNPSFGGAMGRTDLRANVATNPRSSEALVAEGALVLASSLRQAVAKRTPLETGVPKLWIEARTVDLGTTLQGTPVETSFAVANNGDGPMDLLVGGDCGCLSATGPKRLEPGQSGVVRARYDTSALGGGISHQVLIRSTDPERPDAAVTLNVAVRTLARYIIPGTGSVRQGISAAEGRPIEFFLIHDQSVPLVIASSRLDGIPGELNVEPWRGTLADAPLKEGLLARQGYRLTFTPKTLNPGLSVATVTVTPKTGAPIVGNLFLQRGIAAYPTQASFSDPGTTPGRSEVVLTSPGRPFRIVSVKTEGAGVSARAGSAAAARQTVVVTIDPAKLLPGQARRVVVRTDDPERPEIVLPVAIFEG